MDAALFRDFRQGPDWLAAESMPSVFSATSDSLKQQGCRWTPSVRKFSKKGGGLVQQFGTIALVNRAPHPNAARVFINWLLSRNGQIALQKSTMSARVPADSLRIDIPQGRSALRQSPAWTASSISTPASRSGSR
jgi:ABC-type thiamine transport system substrate-binding protein